MTEAGLRQSQLKGTEKVKEDCRTGKRAVGKPVGKYTYAVPRRWVTQGWVEEQEKLNRIYALADKLGVKIGNDSRGV